MKVPGCWSGITVSAVNSVTVRRSDRANGHADMTLFIVIPPPVGFEKALALGFFIVIYILAFGNAEGR